MNTYLVTGSSGFLGGHLREFIEGEGDAFVGVPRHVFMNPVHLERFMFDVKPDVIVHLAAFGNHYNQTDILDMLEVNYTGTFNLLQVTRDIDYKAFINISTSSVTLPHQTFYSATKMGCEYLCKAFASEFKKPIVTLRPYSLYGEGEADFRFIPTVFRSCLEGEAMKLAPEPVHDWTYVGDFVRAISSAAEMVMGGLLSSDSIPIGTGVGTSNQEVVRLIEEITGNKAVVKKHKKIRAYDSKEWISPAPHRKYLTLKEGLERYYKWYLSRGGERETNYERLN